jgi:hypothetical protein
MQTYMTGEEVKVGDIVKWPTDEGKIIALQDELPKWGLAKEDAEGKAMVEFKNTGMVCLWTSSEDLHLIKRTET